MALGCVASSWPIGGLALEYDGSGSDRRQLARVAIEMNYNSLLETLDHQSRCTCSNHPDVRSPHRPTNRDRNTQLLKVIPRQGRHLRVSRIRGRLSI